MSRFDKALQSLQPNVKDIVRTFLLDKNFEDGEYRKTMHISFTTPDDDHLGYRRLELNTYKDDRIPGLYHDTNIVEFKKVPPGVPLIQSSDGYTVKQTFENVMNLIDSTPIKHILTISMRKYIVKSDIIYNWCDVADLAKTASEDRTLSIK
jgi:hypothetical protein